MLKQELRELHNYIILTLKKQELKLREKEAEELKQS